MPTRSRVLTARRLLPALVLALVALVGNAPSAAGFTHDLNELRFIEYINDYRAAHGLSRYWADPMYSYWANWRSGDQCKRRYFSHTIPRLYEPEYWPGGGNLDQYWDYRRLKAGVGVDRFGEIIAYNYYDSGWLRTLFRQFVNSYVHRSMLLSANYKYDRMGVGVYSCGGGRHHVTVVFVQK